MDPATILPGRPSRILPCWQLFHLQIPLNYFSLKNESETTTNFLYFNLTMISNPIYIVSSFLQKLFPGLSSIQKERPIAFLTFLPGVRKYADLTNSEARDEYLTVICYF